MNRIQRITLQRKLVIINKPSPKWVQVFKRCMKCYHFLSPEEMQCAFRSRIWARLRKGNLTDAYSKKKKDGSKKIAQPENGLQTWRPLLWI